MNQSRVLVAAALLAGVLIAGCSKSNEASTSTTTTTTAGSAPTAAATSAADAAAMAVPNRSTATTAGDAGHGKSIFAANCASCHGATGTEGGVGPSLKKEQNRKNFSQTVAWIKNPQPPMPKLYPSPLSNKDVADVAAYVQSL